MKELNKSDKRSVTAKVLIGSFVMIVSLLLVTSFMAKAYASGDMQGHESRVKGKIVAIGTSHETPTITLSEVGKLSPSNPNAEINIFLTDKTDLTMCKAGEPLEDLKVGEKVSVSYHELAGLAVADRIFKPCYVSFLKQVSAVELK